MKYFTVTKPYWALIKDKQIAKASTKYFRKFGYEPEEVKLLEMTSEHYALLKEMFKAIGLLNVIESDYAGVIAFDEEAGKLMNKRVEKMREESRRNGNSEEEIKHYEAYMRDLGFFHMNW